MCGIFGCLGFEPSETHQAREALNTLAHRGRDQWGEWSDRGIYLGHRRLSIIDLSENAKQPFVDAQISVVVNGEIYNYLELRNELKHCCFSSNSDSEIIFHGYKVWGIDLLLKKIDGMYAFAIYDRAKKKLYLAKDRWGKKPLFYAYCRGRFIFASEIKAIMKFAPELRVFSFEGIKHWFAYRGSHNKSTLFHKINRLSPGTYLSVEENFRIKEEKYYDLLNICLNSQAAGDPESYSIEYLIALLKQAIKRRLMSDVPVGLQLSGGVDSSIIAGFLSEYTNKELHSFSVVFDEPEFQEYSEKEYSTRVATKCGFQHHTLGITKAMVGESFAEVLYIFDGMLDYPNAIPLFILNKFAKKYISVVLTGEAADELFGGYRKYQRLADLKNASVISSICPSFLFKRDWPTRLSTHLLRPLYLNKMYKGNHELILNSFNSYISLETIQRFFGNIQNKLLDSFDMGMLRQLPYERQILLIDHMTYLYSLLDRQDRTSMGANIEARLAFLDRDLVEWIIRLDPSILFDKYEGKKPLKTIAEQMYGHKFAYRRKKGFPIPLGQWLNDPDCFGRYYQKIFDDDFLIYEKINKNEIIKWLRDGSFDKVLLNYGDSERMWMRWFLMVVRNIQDLLQINSIR